MMDPAPIPQPPAPAATSQASTWFLFILLLLAVVPYLNTLQNSFVYDDNNEVVTNTYIRGFSHVGEIFSTRILAHLGARGATNYYRPISIFGFLICYKLFGLLPYGFHLANVVLHGIIVCMLFGLSKRLFQDEWLAFIAAALFALHPIHTESVAWVSGVTDLDLAVFYLATFWLFLASARPNGGRSEWMNVGMALSFVLTLLSKEQAITLPLLATLYEHFYRDDRSSTTFRQKLARYGALWLLVPVYVLFRIRFFGAFAPVQLTRNVTWYQAVLSAFPLTLRYLWMMIWPVRLIAYYPFHKSTTPSDAVVLASIVALCLCALIFAALWKRHRLVSFGLIWFFLNIAPVLNSRWLGPNVFTERYLYLPSVGFCWVVAWGIRELWNRFADRPRVWRGALAVGLLVVAVLGFIRIVLRNRDWRDDETYYRVTLADMPEAEGLRLNLGAVYWNRMRYDDAEREWKLALKVSPDSAQLLNNLGLVCAERKQNDEAIAYFERSIRLRPNYTDAHLNLGRLYEAEGRGAEAEVQLQAAVALAPLNIAARNELGTLYFNSGRLQEAEDQFKASMASIPNASAVDSLGDIALRDGQRDAAEKAYRQAAGLDAVDERAHFGLAGILEAQGRQSEAATEYRAVLSVDPLNRDAQAGLKRISSNLPHDETSKP